jgi:hypothetical protein
MSYDLKPVKAPKLKGLGLRLFTFLIESPFFRPLILPGLFKTTGVASFRKRVSAAAPTNYPLVKTSKPTVQSSSALEVTETAVSGANQGAQSNFRFSSINDYAKAYRAGSVSPIGNW